MSFSATCSDAGLPRRGSIAPGCRGSSVRARARARVVAALLCAAVCAAASLLLPAPGRAQATITQDEALALAFPGLRVERRTAYLDEAQLERARARSGSEITQSVITYYVAQDGARPAGVAYFDNHRVRTLGQVLMIVVGPDARIRRTEVLRFAEPPDYRAPERWLALFEGRALTPDLSLKRGIPTMTGATLTAQAVTDAARRVLALHSVIAPFGAQR
jgi:Na+-translocating ferredoxin:NAD+ oxidoreductase subunit G